MRTRMNECEEKNELSLSSKSFVGLGSLGVGGHDETGYDTQRTRFLLFDKNCMWKGTRPDVYDFVEEGTTGKN